MLKIIKAYFISAFKFPIPKNVFWLFQIQLRGQIGIFYLSINIKFLREITIIFGKIDQCFSAESIENTKKTIKALNDN